MKFVKSNKGFMLVEVIIVTVVVVTIMTSLYVVFNRVYNNYRIKNTYVNVDAIYALKNFEDYLIDEFKLNSLLKELSSGYKEITCEGLGLSNNCDTLFTVYKINKLYLVKKNDNKIDEISDPDINQTFKDYITYLNNNIVNASTSDYLFIVETYSIDSDNDSDKKILNKYAYLEL